MGRLPALPLFVLLAVVFEASGSLAIEQISLALGYPSSEIIVENTTESERVLWSTPTARERRQASIMPDPEELIAAYKVSGKMANTFYPIRVWIGGKGAFYNSNTREILDLIASYPVIPTGSGRRRGFGPRLFAGLGEGGVYIGKVKVPSAIREMREPQEKSAIISILHLPVEAVDIRIAMMVALEGGASLAPVTGGEAYYKKFEPLRGDETNARYDVANLFGSLNMIAATAPHISRPIQGSLSVSMQEPDPITPRSKDDDLGPASRTSGRPVSSTDLMPRHWLVASIALLSLVIIIYRNCR